MSKKYKTLCVVYYTDHRGEQYINKNTIVELEHAMTTKDKNIIRIKLKNDSVLKNIDAAIFNACFKPINILMV